MIKKILGGMLVVLILGIGAVYFVFNKPHPSIDRPEFLVSASELITAFEENERAANDKYLGKVVEVHGTVTEVIEKQNSFVLLLGDTSTVSRVSCTLEGENDDMAYGLRAGDALTLRGICSGRLLDVVLVDCRIIPDEP
ncbi:MAG TPA: hypothetical protein VKZ86_05005 [Cyclobacteriaceae bacterium]|nr:hypothetical protein [Cyclobacteriaceae bacterium]